MRTMPSIFTIDVEDWFHILDLSDGPGVDEWEHLPSRVEHNFLRLLELIEDNGGSSTCFFLGWIAERFPHLVREAASRGHEIASHGYSHQLVYRLTPEQFRRDAIRARQTIEDILGRPVHGFRAPGFSVTAATPWFFDELVEAGYSYDSSIFPGGRGHGGWPGASLTPYLHRTCSGRNIAEFPITLTDSLGVRACVFGGGYLRLAPWSLIRLGGRLILDQNRPLVFYVHPREIDLECPRLPMSRLRTFKSYVNLKSTSAKIASICREFQPSSFERAFAQRAEFHEIWNANRVKVGASAPSTVGEI